MGLTESPSITVQDALRQLANSLDAAQHNQRGELVKGFADHYGWSVAKVYRELKKIGWSSGRKTRADKGSTSQCEEVLKELAATQRLGVRKNGKITMETPNARSLLAANGREFTVSNSRLNQLLKDRKMNIKLQKQDRPCQALRSLHPNHVHLVDPSLCLIYYLKDGSQHIMRDDEFYKNKPDNIAKIEDLKVWRYVLTDHYSHTIIVRYYQSKGETQANLYDFLLYAWKQIDGRPFHGVPKILYWDKGSANTAKAIKNALLSLEVEGLTHKAGNPRAKGSVEGANNMVEKLFESRLRYEPVNNVDELNAAVEGWYNAYNADTIPHYDARLKRRYMAEPKARYAIWQIIRKEHLRILPDETVCRYLLSAEPVERKVNADMTVSFKHPVSKQREWYAVGDLPDVHPRAIVLVSPLIYGDRLIMVTVKDYKREDQTTILPALERDDFVGHRSDAAVIGLEMKSQPDTVVEKAGKAADQIAFPDLNQQEIEKAKDKNAVPFNGEIDAHSHLKNVDMPGYMKRPGSELNVPDRYQMQAKPLTHIEACKRLIAELGRALTPEENATVRSTYPDGVPEEQFNSLLTTIQQPGSVGLQLVK